MVIPMLEKIDRNIVAIADWNRWIREVWDPTTDRIIDRVKQQTDQIQELKQAQQSITGQLTQLISLVQQLEGRIAETEKKQEAMAMRVESLASQLTSTASNIEKQLSGLRETIIGLEGRIEQEINPLNERLTWLTNIVNWLSKVNKQVKSTELTTEEKASDTEINQLDQPTEVNLPEKEVNPTVTQPETREQWIDRLDRKGKSQKEIAGIVGISEPAVCKWIKKIKQRRLQRVHTGNDIDQASPSYDSADNTKDTDS